MTNTRVVWKFPLPKVRSTVAIPVGAKVLHMALQGGIPCLWALVDPTAEQETRAFRVHGQGMNST